MGCSALAQRAPVSVPWAGGDTWGCSGSFALAFHAGRIAVAGLTSESTGQEEDVDSMGRMGGFCYEKGTCCEHVHTEIP